MESPAAPDTTLLRDAVPEQKDRMRILAVLADKTMGQVEGLHLSLASLDARVVDATLPLLATFDEVQQSWPSKAVTDSVDLLDLPGYFASIGMEHLLRHQVVALLSCVLLSVSEERRLQWCRLVGFTIDADMLEVASRLWDVHTLTAACEWDSSGGYEDRDNVVEVSGCRNYCMACVIFFLSCLAGSRLFGLCVACRWSLASCGARKRWWWMMRARCAGVEVSWMLQTRRTCDA